MSDRISGFQAGFAARHDAPPHALAAAFAPSNGFAAVPIGAATSRRTAAADGPKHFSPADPSANPTQGWDPLDPLSRTAHVDPLTAARAAGYEEGLAAALAAQQAGVQQLREAAERDRVLLAALIDQLGAGSRLDREHIATRLRGTVLMLVSQLVGEVGISAERLAARIDVACDLLADASESAMLRVHPDDVALLDGHLPKSVFAVGDAAVARGSFVLESASTIVEDGPAMWLDQLSHAIERVPMPQPAPARC